MWCRIRIRLFLVLLLLTPPLLATADPCTIHVTILSAEDDTPLTGVLCRLYDEGDALVGYAITGDQGQADLTISESVTRLSVTLMSYKSAEVRRDRLRCGSELVLRLEPTATKLPEIFAKAPPVVAYKDTVSYDVSSFRVKSDRSIGDVLRKLPGVEVGNSGDIKYQGRAISHLYIEGQDLLENRYNLATQNLPADAIAGVDVMERHTHERILKKRSDSKDVAMNLRLSKDYKARPFGEVSVGAGLAPLLLESKISTTLVRRRSQSMLIGGGNNTGQDVERLFGGVPTVYDLLYRPTPASPFLTTDFPTDIPLPLVRYRFNESGAASLNHLFILSPVQSLRVSATGVADRKHRRRMEDNRYGGEDPWEYREQSGGKRRYFRLSPSIYYEHNSDNVYLSDKLSADIAKVGMHSDIHTEEKGTTADLRESRSLRDLSVKNDLRSIFPLGDLMIRGSLYADYQRIEEGLDVADDPSELFLHHRTLLHSVMSTTKSVGDLMLYLTLTGNMESHRYAVGDAEGRSRLGTLELSPELLYRLPGDQVVMRLTLPVGLTAYGSQETDKRTGSLLPHFSISYAPSDRTTIRLSGKGNRGLRAPAYMPGQLLRRGYRSYYTYADTPERYHTMHVTLTGAYRNLLHMIFMNGTLMAQRSGGDRLATLQAVDGRLVYGVKPMDYQADRLYAGFSLSKSFISTGTVLKGKVDVTHSSRPFLQNQVVYKVPMTFSDLSLSLEQRLSKWGNLLANVGLSTSKRGGEKSSAPLHRLSYGTSLYLFPMETWEATLSYEGGVMEIAEGQRSHYRFLDAVLQYDLSDKVRLRLEGKNLLNTTLFRQVYYGGINDFASEVPLRGRSLLLSLSYRY